jgi:proteic killer suppression protein
VNGERRSFALLRPINADASAQDAVRQSILDAYSRLDDLRVPPGNRLHALAGGLEGQHAVRVNDQYRIVFRFEGSDAFDVRCTAYH